MNSHFGRSRARTSACSSTGALLHHCFPSNLSTTTLGAIVKLRGASSELCTLFIGSGWNSKNRICMRLYTCVCVCVCIVVYRLWVSVSVLQRVNGVIHAHVCSCAYVCVCICVQVYICICIFLQ